MEIKNQNNELKQYSLEELKSMPKSEVIWLDIIQFPLHEKTLNYFKNLYKKNEQRIKRNIERLELKKEEDYLRSSEYFYDKSKKSFSEYKDYLDKYCKEQYPISYNLFYFLNHPSVLNNVYKNGPILKKEISRPLDIKNLINELGMKAGKLETFINVKTEEGKNFLLSLKIKDYWNTRLIVSFVESDLFKVSLYSFSELLNSKTRKREDIYCHFNHHKTILRIRDFFLAIGFKLGDYPFLNEEFWNQIEEESKAKQKKLDLQQTLFALKQIAKDSGLKVDDYKFLQTDFWKKEIANKK